MQRFFSTARRVAPFDPKNFAPSWSLRECMSGSDAIASSPASVDAAAAPATAATTTTRLSEADMQRLSKLANLRVEEGSAAAAEFRVSVSRFVSWLGQIHQDNVFRRTGTTLSDLKPYVSPSRERLVLRLRSDAPPQSQPIVAGTAANTTTTTASPAAAASGAAAAAAAASGGFSFATSTASIGAFDESGLTARDAGGNQPERVLANAACRDQGFFVVPQVVDQDE